ncbi:MAG: substrate-binding domain-containing protein, partial [Caldilineaceae bacterium]|nr:substrate-binding domain-containing protein [Caldilineaceae bacterium]
MSHWFHRFNRILFTLVGALLVAACSALPFATEAEPTATPPLQPTVEERPLLPSAAGGALAEEGDIMQESIAETELDPAVRATVTLPEPSVVLPTIDPLAVEQDIAVGGSATVYPITRRMYRRFVREGYAGIMKIERVGTGEGFRLLCSVGTADIVNAGRMVTADEVELCSSISRTPVPFAIGRAAVSLFVHPENDFVDSVTMAQISTIMTATLWSDVDPQWPAEPIHHLLPRVDSDEFATVVRLAMGGNADALRTAPNRTFFDTNDELIQSFTGQRYAVSFASHILLLQNSEEFLRPVPIDGQLPTAVNILSGRYPLVFPLYLYTDPGILQGKPQVAAFINFYLNHINEEIREVGYFPAAVQDLDAARTQLLEILGE